MAGIQALRKTARCSRTQLAEKSQISRFRVWQIESGRIAASRHEEKVLRRALLELVKERSIAFCTALQEGK